MASLASLRMGSCRIDKDNSFYQKQKKLSKSFMKQFQPYLMQKIVNIRQVDSKNKKVKRNSLLPSINTSVFQTVEECRRDDLQNGLKNMILHNDEVNEYKDLFKSRTERASNLSLNGTRDKSFIRFKSSRNDQYKQQTINLYSTLNQSQSLSKLAGIRKAKDKELDKAMSRIKIIKMEQDRTLKKIDESEKLQDFRHKMRQIKDGSGNETKSRSFISTSQLYTTTSNTILTSTFTLPSLRIDKRRSTDDRGKAQQEQRQNILRLKEESKQLQKLKIKIKIEQDDKNRMKTIQIQAQLAESQMIFEKKKLLKILETIFEKRKQAQIHEKEIRKRDRHLKKLAGVEAGLVTELISQYKSGLIQLDQ